ncbi:lipase family protein [Nocardioides sp. NPDC127514]|uniref:lipase family protein n=1 Tax=unclassified Nocardioides TaxID=2615069 RepID=UPI00332325B2
MALALVAAVAWGVSPALAAGEDNGPGLFGALPPVPSLPVSDFYVPPTPLPEGRPGDVIRREDLPPVPGATVQRIMYLSTNKQGERVPVTGIVLTPLVPAQVPGPGGARPIVTHTPGTRGLADACAPSNFYDRKTVDLRSIEPVQFPAYAQQLAAGITVVITDYVGSGTPLEQEYLVAQSEAQNGIDATRAALRLDSNDDLNGASPLGYMGFSQGGQAAAAIAELLPAYAPELLPHVEGVVSGAPPTDMQEQTAHFDGNPTAGVGFGLAALTGLDAAFPDLNLDRYATPEGRQVFDRVRASCTPENLAAFGTITYGQVTSPDVTTLPAWRAAMAESKLGGTAPEMPTYLFNGTIDTIVPPHMAPKLHKDWCSKGATSEFTSYPGTEHFASLGAVGIPAANEWLLDRLAGKPAAEGCVVNHLLPN